MKAVAVFRETFAGVGTGAKVALCPLCGGSRTYFEGWHDGARILTSTGVNGCNCPMLDVNAAIEEGAELVEMSPLYQAPRHEPEAPPKNGQHEPEPQPAPDPAEMPPLPKYAPVDPALGETACPWLDQAIAFSRQMSPRAYDGFHEAIALWALSTVAARRVTLALGRKRFYPNLTIALVAHTTLFVKSSTVRPMRDVLAAADLAFLLAPDDSTPQAFLHSLAGHPPANYDQLALLDRERVLRRLSFSGQRGWFHDEFGSKLQAMMKDGGFMADFRGILRAFDDVPDTYHYETMTRSDRIEAPYLALLASLTPADLRPYAGRGGQLWGDGFFARVAFVCPPVDAAPGTGRFPDRATEIPAELTDPLRAWHKRLGAPEVAVNKHGDGPAARFEVRREPWPTKFMAAAPEVMDRFYAYHDALLFLAQRMADAGSLDLVGNYGRLGEKALRLAVLFASMAGDECIELRHWARAQTITERWRASLHNLIAQVQQPDPTGERIMEDKIVATLRRHGPMTPAEIARYVRGLSTVEVNDVCARLQRVGVLLAEETTRKGTWRFAVADSLSTIRR